MTIGVLALQGSFSEHITVLQALGHTAVEVRTVEQLNNVDGLIIPGGESTAIGKLLRSTKLDAAISKRAKQGMPLYGTCAGSILVANTVDSDYSLQLIDISIKRNGYGRQRDSFETELTSATDALPTIPGVFIRAPKINRVGKAVSTLYTYESEAVLVRHNNILAGTFHPELTANTTIHQYFAQMVQATATGN